MAQTTANRRARRRARLAGGRKAPSRRATRISRAFLFGGVVLGLVLIWLAVMMFS